MKHTPSPTTTPMSPAHPAPSVRELDASWPPVKQRVDTSRERVLDAAWQLVEHPSDTGYFQELERAVEENKAADDAESDFHQAMGAALRAEREAREAGLPK